MADGTSHRRVVVASAVMIIAGQLLAIGNDLYLKQSDPSDVVLLGVLFVLLAFVVRDGNWARWTTIVLVGLGGALSLVGFALLVVAKVSPGSWAAIESAAPALGALSGPLAAFTASPAFPLLAASVLASALLDLAGVAMLAFAPSVRAAFRRGRPRVV